jgi:hypothetical protein
MSYHLIRLDGQDEKLSQAFDVIAQKQAIITEKSSLLVLEMIVCISCVATI